MAHPKLDALINSLGSTWRTARLETTDPLYQTQAGAVLSTLREDLPLQLVKDIMPLVPSELELGGFIYNANTAWQTQMTTADKNSIMEALQTAADAWDDEQALEELNSVDHSSAGRRYPIIRWVTSSDKVAAHGKPATAAKVEAFVAAAAKMPVKGEVVPARVTDGTAAMGEWSEAVVTAKGDTEVKAAARAARPVARPSRAAKEPGAEVTCEDCASPRKGGVFVEPSSLADGKERMLAVNNRLKWLRVVLTSAERERKRALDAGNNGEVVRLHGVVCATATQMKEVRARHVLLNRRVQEMSA